MATPFDADRGDFQQRIESSLAEDGTHVFELGSSIVSEAFLETGDYQSVSQQFLRRADLPLLRPRIRIREPLSGRWKLSVLLDGEERYARTIEPGSREVDLRDVAIATSDLVDDVTYTLEAKLELLADP